MTNDPNLPLKHAYVQYGCGYSAPPEWINYDASLTLRFERLPLVGRLHTKNEARFPKSALFGNVVDGLPIPAGSCRGVYASHILEHLCLEDFRLALRETFRILEGGGIFRLVVPDLRILAERYATSDRGDPRASHDFLVGASLGVATRPRTLLHHASQLLGKSLHLWMWDEASLELELKNAGFSAVRRASLGDSEDPMFSLVEEPVRFVDACAMEARRPD